MAEHDNPLVFTGEVGAGADDALAAAAAAGGGLLARSIGIIATPAYVRVAQTLGLAGAGILAGHTMALSTTLAPSLLLTRSPTLLARQFLTAASPSRSANSWAGYTSLVRRYAAPPALAACLLFLASREPSVQTRAFAWYTASAGMLGAAGMWEWAAMQGVEGEIVRRSGLRAGASSDASAGASAAALQDGKAQAQLQPSASTDAADRSDALSAAQVLARRAPPDAALTVHQLLDKWAVLNAAKAALVAGACLCAAWAVVSEDLSFFELIDMGP